MAEWLPLAEVASHPGLAERAFSRRGAQGLTRAGFVQAVEHWRQRLLAEPGERWALFTEDSADFAAMLYGAWHAGKTVLLPGDMLPATLARLTSECDGYLGLLPGALADAGSTTATPSPDPQPRQPPPLDPLQPATTRLIVFTSGSGGEPVAIYKSLAQLDAEMRTLQAAFGARLDAAAAVHVASTVSHQHIYGLLFVVLWSLAAGRTFLAERLAYLERLPNALGGAPGILVASPAHLRRVPELPALPSLLAVFSSGGPLPPDAAADALARLGHSPIEVFGSSETGGIASRQRAHDGDRWHALPGIAWRVDEGLLSVRSSHLPEPLEWFTTTDQVNALADGSFELRGRADRIVKVGEKRVSLTAIERALLSGGELLEARALLLADNGAPGAEPRIGVVAVPSSQGQALLAGGGRRALSEHLRERLVGHVERVALPRRWRFLSAIPVNLQGKSTEALLLAQFAVAGSVPEAQWLERSATAARLSCTPSADLAVFDGHFPGSPILPGVAQLDWAIAWAREVFEMPQNCLSLDALKFRQTVSPGTSLQLALQWRAERSCLHFEYSSSQGVHASGRVTFGPASDAS